MQVNAHKGVISAKRVKYTITHLGNTFSPPIHRKLQKLGQISFFQRIQQFVLEDFALGTRDGIDAQLCFVLSMDTLWLE